ncbi:hypothetical protein [Nocardia sp. NPDC004260]
MRSPRLLLAPSGNAEDEWNLAGYRYGHAPSGTPHRHAFGGRTDAAFRMIPLLEAGRDADRPFRSATYPSTG